MISVVIPTHRRGQLVVRAVESVLASSIKPAEIIVVEDQSHEALISLDKYINSGLVKYFQKPDDSSGQRQRVTGLVTLMFLSLS